MCLFFFFNDTATTEIYTLSLHDALPISLPRLGRRVRQRRAVSDLHPPGVEHDSAPRRLRRSEEHTSELQSQSNLVCRLLLEKKKKQTTKRRALITTMKKTSVMDASSSSL